MCTSKGRFFLAGNLNLIGLSGKTYIYVLRADTSRIKTFIVDAFVVVQPKENAFIDKRNLLLRNLVVYWDDFCEVKK